MYASGRDGCSTTGVALENLRLSKLYQSSERLTLYSLFSLIVCRFSEARSQMHWLGSWSVGQTIRRGPRDALCKYSSFGIRHCRNDSRISDLPNRYPKLSACRIRYVVLFRDASWRAYHSATFFSGWANSVRRTHTNTTKDGSY